MTSFDEGHGTVPRDLQIRKPRVRKDPDGFWRFYCIEFGQMVASLHFEDAIWKANVCAKDHPWLNTVAPLQLNG